MRNLQQTSCDCHAGIDRMINEGLGGGMIDSTISEARFNYEEKLQTPSNRTKAADAPEDGFFHKTELYMESRELQSCDCYMEIDRMINEGLGSERTGSSI